MSECQDVRVEQIFIPWMAPSLNVIWRAHWKKRAGVADEGYKAALVAKGIPSFDSPVELEFQPFVTKRRYDATNYIASTKILEDALVKFGILKDDGPEYVASIKIIAPVKAKEHGILLTIRECKNET